MALRALARRMSCHITQSTCRVSPAIPRECACRAHAAAVAATAGLHRQREAGWPRISRLYSSARAGSRSSNSSSDTFLFTSESVTEGHPDKLCDQVSDAVLDACLSQDPNSKVACEAAVKDNFLLVFGEITSHAQVDYAAVARQACRDIGYTSLDLGFDADSAEVRVLVEQQSPEIGQGVHGMGTKRPEELGAGDQGHMFGYACSETPELMPLTHTLASQLAMRLAAVRKSGQLPWLRPDGKTQVTVEYGREGGHLQPQRLHTLLISTQHHPDISQRDIAEELQQHVIGPVVPPRFVDEATRFIINPSGSFVVGGPCGDAGLTGRKIIVDTYGGWGAHGGGAFSGKDPTKVDRSAAYAARQAAKSVVAAGLAERCLIQISYGIGVPEPLSLFCDTYGTGKVPDRQILEAVQGRMDFRPGVIIERLKLQDGRDNRYRKTAAYGHFGRNHDPTFTWEAPVKL